MTRLPHCFPFYFIFTNYILGVPPSRPPTNNGLETLLDKLWTDSPERDRPSITTTKIFVEMSRLITHSPLYCHFRLI